MFFGSLERYKQKLLLVNIVVFLALKKRDCFVVFVFCGNLVVICFMVLRWFESCPPM